MFPQISSNLAHIVELRYTLISLKYRFTHELLSTANLSNIFHDIVINHNLLDYFYIATLGFAFIASINERNEKNKFRLLKAVGLTGEIEKKIEIFLFIAMMVMTKNIENAI